MAWAGALCGNLVWQHAGEVCEAWAGGYSWCRQVCATMLSNAFEQCAAGFPQITCLLCHRYLDHRICPQAALADLAVATFHRGINLRMWPTVLLPPLACRGTSPCAGIPSTYPLAGV